MADYTVFKKCNFLESGRRIWMGEARIGNDVNASAG